MEENEEEQALGQQLMQQIKQNKAEFMRAVTQKLKDMAKEALKRVASQIWSAISPYLPYIIAAIVILIILISCYDGWNELGVTGSAGNYAASGWWWPIGGTERTTSGGKVFASGTPPATVETSAYGEVRSYETHYAIDVDYCVVTKPEEENIIAANSGTVTFAGYNGGAGNEVIIDHGGGFKSIYMHMENNSLLVKTGDHVEHGQVLGLMGTTGNSTGDHLHFAIHLNGTPVNPYDYVDPDNPRPVLTSLNNVSTTLVDYLLFFGGDSTTVTIDGREFYKIYDDTAGNMTVGLDVYMANMKSDFSVEGYVSDTSKGPSKKVDNVYDYANSKFSSGTCIYVEKALADKVAEKEREYIQGRVDTLETKVGTTFTTQQRYALCAIVYRRNK